MNYIEQKMKVRYTGMKTILILRYQFILLIKPLKKYECYMF